MATDIFVGNVSIGVTPDLRGWDRRMRAELVPSSSRVGEEVGNTISRQIVDSMGKSGTESAGAFSENFRKRLKAALQALPKAEIDGDSTKVDRKLAELRRRLEELSKMDVINSKHAMAELAVIEKELGSISRKADGIDVKFNVDRARVQLAMLKREVDSVGSGSGGRSGLLGGVFSGGGDAAGAGAKAGGGGLSAAGGLSLSNPYIMAGVAALAAAIAPFLGQAIAGGIILGLGGALAGIGIIGAIMTGKLTKQFDTFKANAKKDIESIGTAFIPVLQHIMAMAGIVLDEMTPVFRAVVTMIAGPVEEFVDAILRAFTQPAVKKSIDDVAKSFSAIVTALTPEVPGIANAFAHGITAVANAIAQHPQAFASFIKFLALIVEGALMAIAWLAKVAAYIIEHFWPAMHQIAVVFDGVRHEIAHIWDIIFNNTIGAMIRIHQGIQHWLSSIGQNIRDQWHLFQSDTARIWNITWNNTIGRAIRGYQDLVKIFRMIRDGAVQWWHNVQTASANIWNTIWTNTVGRAIRGVQDLMRIIGGIRDKVVSALNRAATWLVDAGKNVISGLMAGMKAAIANIGGWIKSNVVDPVVSWIKRHFGISSPATSMMPLGKSLIQGLLHGMLTNAKDIGGFIAKVFGGWPEALGSIVSKGLVNLARLPAKALSALGGVASKVGGFFAKLFTGGGGGGASRWAGVVAQALAMLGLPLSLSGQVLHQIQTESGGNPNAINNWDVNAARGDPSRGLLQTIGSTFAAYHVPGTSFNIYDPLANVAAAINYARHTYGPNLMRGSMGLGSGSGYDEGGWLPPGVTMAVNRTGENELVMTADQLRAHGRGGDGSAMYVAHFDGLTGQAIEGHVRTAFAAMSVTQGNLNRQGRRR